MSIPRPKFSPELARFAAEDIVAELIKGGHLDGAQRDDSVADLVKHGRSHEDGYQLAKNLDDYAHWDCDFQMCEILDGFACAVSSHITKAEKDWVALTAPQPPFPIGTRIRVGRSEPGEITGIYEYGAAKYLVKIDGDPRGAGPHGSRRVVNFEDAKPEAEAA